MQMVDAKHLLSVFVASWLAVLPAVAFGMYGAPDCSCTALEVCSYSFDSSVGVVGRAVHITYFGLLFLG